MCRSRDLCVCPICWLLTENFTHATEGGPGCRTTSSGAELVTTTTWAMSRFPATRKHQRGASRGRHARESFPARFETARANHPEVRDVLQFMSVGRRGKHHTDLWVRQTEPVTVARHGRLISWWIFRRGFEKRTPPQSRKGDHG